MSSSTHNLSGASAPLDGDFHSNDIPGLSDGPSGATQDYGELMHSPLDALGLSLLAQNQTPNRSESSTHQQPEWLAGAFPRLSTIAVFDSTEISRVVQLCPSSAANKHARTTAPSTGASASVSPPALGVGAVDLRRRCVRYAGAKSLHHWHPSAQRSRKRIQPYNHT